MDFSVAHGPIWGIFLLFFLAVMPRITTAAMIIWGALTSGGVGWWLGWIFLPHVLVAYEACTTYWETNPILCCMAVFVALTGTGTETKVVSRKRRDT